MNKILPQTLNISIVQYKLAFGFFGFILHCIEVFFNVRLSLVQKSSCLLKTCLDYTITNTVFSKHHPCDKMTNYEDRPYNLIHTYYLNHINTSQNVLAVLQWWCYLSNLILSIVRDVIDRKSRCVTKSKRRGRALVAAAAAATMEQDKRKNCQKYY